jgi:hypothetical protein
MRAPLSARQTILKSQYRILLWGGHTGGTRDDCRVLSLPEETRLSPHIP